MIQGIAEQSSSIQKRDKRMNAMTQHFFHRHIKGSKPGLHSSARNHVGAFDEATYRGWFVYYWSIIFQYFNVGIYLALFLSYLFFRSS